MPPPPPPRHHTQFSSRKLCWSLLSFSARMQQQGRSSAQQIVQLIDSDSDGSGSRSPPSSVRPGATTALSLVREAVQKVHSSVVTLPLNFSSDSDGSASDASPPPSFRPSDTRHPPPLPPPSPPPSETYSITNRIIPTIHAPLPPLSAHSLLNSRRSRSISAIQPASPTSPTHHQKAPPLQSTRHRRHLLLRMPGGLQAEEAAEEAGGGVDWVAAAAGAGRGVRDQQQAAGQGRVQQQKGRRDLERSRQSFCHLMTKWSWLGMLPAIRARPLLCVARGCVWKRSWSRY
jgi:hypothetical protein